MDDPLTARLEGELARAVPAAAAQLASQLAERAGGQAVAVLFYGSALRDDALDGLLDFYVLLDDVRAWPGSRLAAAANRCLPPNVGYWEQTLGGRRVRAKVAVMSLAQFVEGVAPDALDTTLWARFSQPCVCPWARSEADRAAVVDALRLAVVTAATFAATLGPLRGTPADYWRALFAQTYGAELRVERTSRGDDLVSRHLARYESMLPEAWREAGVSFESYADGTLEPCLAEDEREASAGRWARRRALGKPLNLLRLAKAAFTFDGAADYVAWKVERHSGVKLEISEWQRRHPLLAAPGIYWRLRRRGVIR